MADKKISELTETSIIGDADLLTTVQAGVNKKITGATGKEQFGLNKFIAMGEPNGIVDRTLSTISFVNGTRTFSINPTGSDFDYYIAAVKYTTAGNNIVIADTEGLHLIYYDGASLAEIINPSNSQITNILLNKAIVAYIEWDATNNKGKLLEERHGITMDGATHVHLHFSLGAQYQDGLALGDFLVNQDGSLDTHAQFSTALGTISDEDLQLAINAITSTTGLEIWYLDSSDWRWTTNAGFSVRTAGTGRLAFNDSGTQTEVTNNNFVLCHVFAWNATDQKPIAIQGQAQYGNITAAREGAQTEIANLILSGLPSPEMKPIGTVIFQTSNTYTNAVKGRVRTTDTGEDYVDFRKNPLNATVTASDHGQLAGLVDDDHLQYVLLVGRAGGQTIYGGTGASEDLILGSTSHATKGVVRSMDDFSIDTGKAYQFNKVDFMSAPGTNNVCIGFNTNGSITTAQDSVFIGTEAGDQTTTGSQNVYIGYQAGKTGTTAQFNLAIGYQAGYGLTNASNNVFIGNSAGRTLTTGTKNVFIGVSAGLQTTTANDNVAIGYHAGRVNNANAQVFIGYEAGKAMLTGADNVFIGNKAGNVATTTANSVLIGSGAGIALTTGNNNILIGKGTGELLTTQSNNILMGYEVGKNLIADHTTAIGYTALYTVTTGQWNSAFGYQAGYSVPAAGTHNTCIGGNADVYTGGGNTGIHQTSVGYSATCWGDYSCQLSASSLSPTKIGVLRFKTQQVCLESWIDTNSYFAYIDATGNFVKGDQQLLTTSNITHNQGYFSSYCQSTGFRAYNNLTPTSGEGLEMQFNDSIHEGFVASYNRTTPAFLKTNIIGSQIGFRINSWSTDKILLTSTGFGLGVAPTTELDVLSDLTAGIAKFKSKTGITTNAAVVTIDTTDVNDETVLQLSKSGTAQWRIISKNELDAPNNRLAIYDDTSEVVTILQNGNVGILDNNPTEARLAVAQNSSTAGLPVLSLTQIDTSEGFIDFVGTDLGAISTSTSHAVTIEVNSVKYALRAWDLS